MLLAMMTKKCNEITIMSTPHIRSLIYTEFRIDKV